MAANGQPARTLLVLWDVDGTLVDTAGHGRHAFGEAFEAVFGREPADDPVPMAGRTDHAIALDLLARNSIDDPERHLPEMFDALHDALDGRRDAIAAEGRPQPGVPEALRAVGTRADVLQSLLTGNIERNAEIKLGAFGLERHVDLEIGGYGSDHGTRSELVGIARGRRASCGVSTCRRPGRCSWATPRWTSRPPTVRAQGRWRSPRARIASTSSSRPVPTRRSRTCATPRPCWQR